jgi:hypothetical protein
MRSFGIAMVVWCALASWTSPLMDEPPVNQPRLKGNQNSRPFLAIWRDSEGNAPGSQSPFLRVAIWNDGSALFSMDPTEHGQELKRGRIAPYRVERLKAALRQSGVFDLKGYCYLGPDMPVDCVMVDLGDRRQMLYWVEGKTDWMKKPNRIEFVRSWTAVKHLASVACPDVFEAAKGRFEQPPKSWYLKEMIQSE